MACHMDSAKATKGERDLPETEQRRPTGLGTVTAVFLLSLPLLILFFLFGDRAVFSIAGDSLVWQRTGVQSTCSFRSLAYTHLMHGNGPALTLPFVCIAGSGNASSSPVNAHHDLLLGGLLSPDFDAATCLSRYEASKRWKTPSPFLVSPYLVQKLRQYESNHRGADRAPRTTARPWRSSRPAATATAPNAGTWCGSPSRAWATRCSASSPPSSTRCSPAASSSSKNPPRWRGSSANRSRGPRGSCRRTSRGPRGPLLK